jgi:hypothetical protein
MTFELRSLKADDLFLMFSILSKIGFNDIKEILTPEKVKEITSAFNQDEASEDMSTFLGFNIVFSAVEIILKNLPSCKKEIYTLLSSLSGMTPTAIADLDMVTFTEMVIAVVKKEEFKDFFKAVAKLFN